MWNTKLWIALMGLALAAGCAWFGYSKGRQSGMQEVQTLWTAEKLAMEQAKAEELMKARQQEQALQALLDKQRREHRNEVNRIVREHAGLVDSLRNRPEARAGAGGVPEGAAAGVGCTGAGLSAGDAAFLAGLAADAARTQAALALCVADRAEIERQLNGSP
jgi:hypothetical protein